MTQTRIHVSGLAEVTIAALLSSVLLAAEEAERFWPQWRGPYANGVSRTSRTADPPLEWSETKTIRWKIGIRDVFRIWQGNIGSPHPPGARQALLTGAGVVPPDSFTLEGYDFVRIAISGIGVLENPVAVV